MLKVLAVEATLTGGSTFVSDIDAEGALAVEATLMSVNLQLLEVI